MFLHHKTTVRGAYERAIASVQALGCQDVLLWNERGELIESSSANLEVEIDGVKYTPPVACGLLGGTYRGALLAERRIVERVLPMAALEDASGVWLINSVRKWVVVERV